jgi:hypothetical protein
MSRIALLFFSLFLTAVLFIVAAVRWRHNEMSESNGADTNVAAAADDDCGAYLSHNPSLLPEKLVESESKSLSRSDFPTLTVEGSHFDAVTVKGWERPDIQLTVCKVAAAPSKERAAEILKRISVEVAGGRLSARGPAITSSVFVQNARVMDGAKFKTSGDETFWLVHYFLRVPHDLEVSVGAESGDISLGGLSGRVRARSENGGISLSGVGGSVEARTDNGGITLDGGWGEVRLRSDNGGVDIRLAEGAWRGGALEASAENGGLTVEVPPRFSSTIEAVTSAGTPLRCELQGCGPARRDGGRQRLRVGDAEPSVRVSTENGELRIRPTR